MLHGTDRAFDLRDNHLGLAAGSTVLGLAAGNVCGLWWWRSRPGASG